MAKVQPMKTSDSIARTITVAMTIDLPETVLPLRVSSSCLSPLIRTVRMGMSPRLIEIMFRATSSKIVTNVGT